MRRIQLAAFFIICVSYATAQETGFYEYLYSKKWTTQTLEQTKKELDEYFSKHKQEGNNEVDEEGGGYRQYQRWMYEMERRYSAKEIPDNYAARNITQFQTLKDTISPNQMTTVHNGFWYPLNIGTHTTGRNTGSVNCIAFHPTITTRLYAGTPAGGLYQSNDNGANWDCITPNFASLGVSSVAFDPLDPNIMYAMTGDGDGGQSPCLGVYRTTDGGINWAKTGLSFDRTDFVWGRDIRVCPTNRNALIACTTDGVYRSPDAGVTWVKEITGNFFDVEFKPGSQTCYAASNAAIYYSDDAGNNWYTASLSPTIAGSVRIELAVTPAAPGIVYAIVAGSQFMGLYASTNSGFSYARRASSPNMTSYPADGSGANGQEGYDLSICVSPTDANIVFIAGINIWKSTNAGTSFGTLANAWYYAGGAKYVHEDNHCLEAKSSTEIWTGCDGGIFKTTDGGNNWGFSSTYLYISQYYHMDNYPGASNYFFGGTQDNGGQKWDAGSYTPNNPCCDAGAALINYRRRNTVYMNGSNAFLYRSGNGFSGSPDGDGKDITPFYGCNCQDTSGAFIVEALAMHPTDTNTIYAMYKDFFVSNNRGNNWTRYSTGIGCCVHRAMAVAPSNPNVIYAIISSNFRWSNNGGATWYNIPFPSGITSVNYTGIAVDPSNAYHVWLTNGGYQENYKAFEYTGNGGTAATSWTMTNRGMNLPNVPVFCAEWGSNGVYIGTDIGVYFFSYVSQNWVYFGNGLPYVSVRELRFDAATETITAATFGMGLWQSFSYGACPSYVIHSPGGLISYIPQGDDVLQAADSLRSSYYFQGGEGMTMKYTAGDRIRLVPGFGVRAGTTLKASIQGCNTQVILNVVPIQASVDSSLQKSAGKLEE